jgi:exopolyphosphatase/guanosine-5'-triphosphate,3'-diphosphate pyrophosphatase
MSGTEHSTGIAAIDIGSNTIHLVVARPAADRNALEPLADETELVRLGADVAVAGAIGQERAARAVEVVRGQVARARSLGATPILGIATEGVRAASNGLALLDRIRAEAGLVVHLVTGEQEAALTYWGATSGRVVTGRAAVIDLGGGSTEIVVGEGERVTWRVSLPLGSGTIHDRVAPADPADPAELAAAARLVEDALAGLAIPLPVAEAAVCGGAATSLAALASRAGLAVDVPDGGGHRRADLGAPPDLTPARCEALIALLETLPAVAIARRYGVDEGRARLLAPGAVVIAAATRRLGVARVRVSRRGIREGAILAYLRHGDGWLDAAARG